MSIWGNPEVLPSGDLLLLNLAEYTHAMKHKPFSITRFDTAFAADADDIVKKTKEKSNPETDD